MEQSKPAGGRRVPLAMTDLEPAIDVRTAWRPAAQFATIGLFLLACIAALDYGRPILLPVVSAFMLGIMMGPLLSLTARAGIPSLVSALVVWLVVIGIFYGFIVLLSAPIVESVGKAPQLGEAIKDKLHVLDRPISALRNLQNALLPRVTDNKELSFSLESLVRPAVTFVTPAIGQMVVFFGTLFFVLLGRVQMRQFLVGVFDERDSRLRMLRILNDIESNLTGYLSVVAVINLFVGLGAMLVALMAGLPNPVAWGVLGFIFNFVPYIGALMMELIFLAVGLLSFPTLGQALVAPLAYLTLTTLEGHFITPSIMGQRLLLNPLIVFLSLVFWTWIWGPVGALLAVPLLIVILVAVNHLFPKEEAVLPD